MVRMTVLASGSLGNSTVVASSRTRILLDAGLSCRELLKRLRAAGEEPELLDAILVTHEHQDHVQGLEVLARKLGIPVYFTEATHRAWMRWVTPKKTISYAEWLRQRQTQQALTEAGQQSAGDAPDAGNPGPGNPGPRNYGPGNPGEEAFGGEPEDELLCLDTPAQEAELKRDPGALPAVEYFSSGHNFSIGDIEVTPFTIPHDAADPVGFVFRTEGVKIGIATDLGYMPPNVRMHLKDADILMLESNHDLEMLRDGPYPWSVKQRVLSRVGHLSNDSAAEFLSGEYDGCAAFVVLAHLSGKNNLPNLARIAAERALGNRMNLLANRLLLAQQHRPLEAICL